jgi:hypothetical protein
MSDGGVALVQWLIESGRIVDVALAVIAVEVVALATLRRALGRGPSVAAILWNAAAGASMLLALRAGLTGAGWTWTAGFFALALATHVVDVSLRWAGSRAGAVRSSDPRG